jgi:hypothetical protein
MVTTVNYSAIANAHIEQFIIARNKSSQFVLTSRFLVTDPNNVFCLRPYRLANVVFQSLPWEYVFLRNRYSATSAIYMITTPLLSNGSACYNMMQDIRTILNLIRYH